MSVDRLKKYNYVYLCDTFLISVCILQTRLYTSTRPRLFIKQWNQHPYCCCCFFE
ncbi:hypothetical protein Hanom_Chr16g01497051 [Helianthus anomalus]